MALPSASKEANRLITPRDAVAIWKSIDACLDGFGVGTVAITRSKGSGSIGGPGSFSPTSPGSTSITVNGRLLRLPSKGEKREKKKAKKRVKLNSE